VQQKLAYKFLRYGLLSVIALMPFHAFLTTWLVGSTEYLLWARAWKEVVVTLLSIVGLFYFIIDAKLRSIIWGRTINKLILAYGLWLLLVSALVSRDVDSLAQGLAINMRFFTVFVLMQVVLFYQPISRRLLYRLITFPAIGVVVFGLMQIFVLPRDFLTRFNYNKNTTIPPFFTIDEQLTNLRYASTLSGPNTLGAYLVLPMLLIAERTRHLLLSIKKASWVQPVFHTSFFFFLIILLYGTHSRSAWLAAAITLAVYILFVVPKRWRITLAAIGIGFTLMAGIGMYQYQDTQFVQDVILHDDPVEGGEVSSNAGHLEALQSGVEDIAQRPLLGCGVGCAGPASVRAEETKISESYYLQVGQEAGAVALGLFITLIILVGKELYKKRRDTLALIMFASLLGLSVSNLLLHTWADETLAIIWWSVAAAALYTKIPTTSSKSDLNPI